LVVEVLEDRTVPSVDVVTGDPKDWPMYNHDPEGSRHASAETQLRPDNVSGLEVKWTFLTEGPVAALRGGHDRVYVADARRLPSPRRQPAVADALDVGPTIGNVKVTASALVTNRTVVIGDLSGRIHGLDVDTGAVRWTVRPPSPNPVVGDQNPYAAIFGSPTMVGNYVAIGTSSNEWLVAPSCPRIRTQLPGSLSCSTRRTGRSSGRRSPL
jgi:polyvinyl alcohol dehydrogenase (cytochrome)